MTAGRLASLIVALLAVAGLVVVVRDGGAGRPTTVAGLPAPTVVPATDLPGPTTSVPAPSAAAAAPTTIAPRTAAARPVPTSTPPQAGVTPGRAVPPPAGSYRYRYGGSGPSVDGTLVVTAGPGAGRQTFVVNAGDGSEQTVVDWSSGARTTVSVGTAPGPACTWAPGLLSLKLPLSSALAWSVDSTCAEAASTVHRTEDARVEGAARTTVAGQAVDVWLISRHTLTEITAGPSSKAVVEAQSSELFAPSLGLVVYQVTRTVTPQADGTTVTTTQTAELLDSRAGV